MVASMLLCAILAKISSKLRRSRLPGGTSMPSRLLIARAPQQNDAQQIQSHSAFPTLVGQEWRQE
jgi:hypothetical protein